jgi:hypothetical protein
MQRNLEELRDNPKRWEVKYVSGIKGLPQISVSAETEISSDSRRGTNSEKRRDWSS